MLSQKLCSVESRLKLKDSPTASQQTQPEIEFSDLAGPFPSTKPQSADLSPKARKLSIEELKQEVEKEAECASIKPEPCSKVTLCADSCCTETKKGKKGKGKSRAKKAPAEGSETTDKNGKPRRKSGPKKGVVTACPHVDLPLYALGMCNHCYHKYGRTGMATDCIHAGERKVYAKGKCQSCYINDYNKQKRREKKLLKKEKQALEKALREQQQLTAETLEASCSLIEHKLHIQSHSS